MITLNTKYGNIDEPRLFYALSTDITNGDHLYNPLTGTMKCNNIKLRNADRILCIDTTDLYFFDISSKTWLLV